ncbi:MAG: M48 family metalloprotease [Verrucomicrobia bacterium]|nr:M48 family metalloprotease [Verrucomicrobiota bacterium]
MKIAMDLVTHPFSQRLGWALLHFVWQGALVALGLAGLLLLLRRNSARLRWAVSCAALTLMAVLPIFTAWHVDVAGIVEPVAPTERSARTGEAGPLAGPSTGEEILMASPVPMGGAGEHAVASRPPAPVRSRFETLMSPLMPWALLGWMVGVVGMTVWHLGGWCRVRRLLHGDLRPVDPLARQCLASLLDRQPLRRTVRLMESLRVHGPLVVGVLRPVILLPVGLVTGLTPAQLEAILAHELAHVRRWDGLVLLLQATVETLLFYHPAVWWVSGQIRKECERCCDDLAMDVCPDRLLYAETLAEVAARSAGHGVPTFASGAGGKGLLSRIRRLLEGPPSRPGGRWPALCGGMAGLALLVWVCVLVFAQSSPAKEETLSPEERLSQVMEAVSAFKGQEALGIQPHMEEVVVSGRVVTAGGEPLPEGVALFMGFDNVSRNLPVDDEGRFEYHAPAPPGDRHGSLHLAVSSPRHQGISRYMELPPDGRLEDLEFALEPGETLMLWFVDERDGSPMEGVRVRGVQLMAGPDGGSGSLVGVPHRDAEFRSDEMGRVRIPHVNPDLHLRVFVELDGFEHGFRQHRWKRGPDSQGNPLVGDGVAEVPEGGWRWPLTPALPFQGRVVDSRTGDPVVGAEILKVNYRNSRHLKGWPADLETTPDAVTDSEGRFLLNTLARDVPQSLFVRAEGHAGALLHEIQSGQPPLEVVLSPPLHLQGKIRGDLGKLDRSRRTGEPYLNFGFLVPSAGGWSRYAPVTIEDGVGTFLIPDLWPGEWRLRVGVPHTLGTFTLKDSPLENLELHLDEVPPRAGTRPVEIRLLPPEGDPPPAGFVAVSYLRDWDRVGVNARYAAAKEIRFEAAVGERLQITPGDIIGYSFHHATENVPGGEGPYVVEIPLQPAGVVRGRLLPPPGEEGTFRPEGFRVSASDQNHHLNASVNADGRFLLSPMTLGNTFRIHAIREQMLILGEPVTMNENTPVREITLQAVSGVPISGKVTHARTGAPLADTRVGLITDFEPGRSIQLQSMTTGSDGRFEALINPNVPFPYEVNVGSVHRRTTLRIDPGEELHIELDPQQPGEADSEEPQLRAFPNLLSPEEGEEVQRAFPRIQSGMDLEAVMAILRTDRTAYLEALEAITAEAEALALQRHAPPPLFQLQPQENSALVSMTLRVEKEHAEQLGFTFDRMATYFSALQDKHAYETKVVGDTFVLEMRGAPDQLRRILEVPLTTDRGHTVPVSVLCTVHLHQGNVITREAEFMSIAAQAESLVDPQSVDKRLAEATRSLRNDLTVEIPNTRSPDGRYALFAISIEGTAGVTGIASTDRQRCLALTSVFNYGLSVDDRRPQSYLTVLWSADSSHVAIHDSARKHSRLEVYRVSATTAQEINVVDVLARATGNDPLVSSGQEPLEWVENNGLVVECRGRLQTGEMYRKRVTVHIANETTNPAQEDTAPKLADP